MQELEYQFSPFELKASDATPGLFTGMGSTFGNTDLGRDIVMPGAFAKSLKRTGAKGIRMLFQHDSHEPVGEWLSVEENDKGLPVEGQLFLDDHVPVADKTYTLMRHKTLSLSIGYRTKRDEIERDTGIRRLIELDLMEISLVTFPMNPKAVIRTIKTIGTDEITTKRELEKALRDAGFTNSVAEFVAAGWTPPAKRDASGEMDQLIARIEEASHVLTH